jgi:UDP-N-acetylmuramoyl-L-alanyl-D-glutamate--2,6-diaminopimelate ligase
LNVKKVLDGITYKGILPEGVDIGHITCVSNECDRNTLFFALKGEKRDGAAFVPDAFSRGCRIAAVHEDAALSFNNDLSGKIIALKDCRAAMAIASANLFGLKNLGIKICGITGTSGKTTVSYLADSILRGSSPSTIIGTINHIVYGEIVESNNTTPESFTISELVALAASRGAQHAVLEVSSHSLKQKRVHAIDFDAAVFTNLTRDHLDYHLTERDYMESKLILFHERVKKSGVAVINCDDSHSLEFIRASRAGVITYGVNNKSALIRALSVEDKASGTKIHVSTPDGCVDITTRLRGIFNVYNVLAAVGVGIGLGYDNSVIVNGINRVESVNGRFESVDGGQPFSIIVDYAHKPDALLNILRAARKITRGRIICVFGCGGDRDKGKRAIMGGISNEHADITIVTSDNPRTEDPSIIINDVVAGIGNKSNLHIEADRRNAIASAMEMAREGDTVIIAGKGHETYQITGKEKIHFDDKEEALVAVRKIYGNKN